MNYYLWLICLISLITLLCKIEKIDIKTNKNYLLFICIILTLFLGFRANHVGLDMKNYEDFFNLASNSSFSYLFKNVQFELGFKIYTKIISLFFNNYSIFIFITSLLSMIGVYDFIKENSKNYFASIYLFITFNFYIYLFCTLRQVLAISILLLSTRFIKSKDFRKFILLVLLATLFHKTAIVFSIVYFIPYIKLTKEKINYFCIGALILFLIKNPLIDFFTSVFYSQYENYMDTSGTGYTTLFLFFGLLIGIIYIFKNFKLSEKNNQLFIGMLMITIPLQILATTQGLIARLTLYFSISILILIPNVLENEKNENFKNVLYFFYYVSLFFFYYFEILGNTMYVPYQFLF